MDLEILKDVTSKVDDKLINNNIYNWQKLIGYIPQNIIILNASLRDNLLLAQKIKNFQTTTLSN